MNTTQQKRLLLIDVALFIVLIICFFLDLTGVILHQWLGIAAGIAAGYHLITHQDWVSAVTRRFFGKTSKQARLYYIIDALLLAGFATMIATGLIISTWLNLALTNYAVWRTIHVAASIGTLAVVVLKIALHQRWILSTVKKLAPAPAMNPRTLTPAVQTYSADRRAFLKMMGTVGAVTVIAAGKPMLGLLTSGDRLNTPEADTSLTSTAASASSAGTVSTVSTSNTGTAPTISPTAAVTSTSTVVTTNSSSPAVQAVSASSSESNSTACVLLCNRKCSYPGRCRRYVDNNSNGLCDRGECLS